MANYQLNESKMFADVTDGVAIIINSETGIYYGFNTLGTVVYENLVNGASVGDVLNALKQIDAPADIEAKLNSFVKTMLDKELIIDAEASSKTVQIDENVAKEDNFEFVCEEYNDAQDMLLADPIHEVKEETGWTPEADSIGYSKEETIEREKKSE